MDIVIRESRYHSPCGRLGETQWALVSSPAEEIHVYGTKTGRRITDNGVKLIYKCNGEVIDGYEDIRE